MSLDKHEAIDTDYEFMKLAIEEANNSEGKEDDPKVGAVLVKEGQEVGRAHRGQKDHAEFALLHKNLRSKDLTEGATLYTTLEPCTTRGHDKLPCAAWAVKKGIQRVVIGILDPNPTICGKGYWIFMEKGIDVDLFPPELARQIKELNARFIDKNRGSDIITAEFDREIQNHKDATIKQYIGLGWGEALTLVHCPNLREGWPLNQVRIRLDETTPFQIPNVYEQSYKDFYKRHYEDYRFCDDKENFMVTHNPIAFIDTPSLLLNVKPTKYSYIRFYRDHIAISSPERRKALIKEFVQGTLVANFSGGFTMQMVVVTADNKILLPLRSSKVAFHPNTWSASVEEHITREDFAGAETQVASYWAVRLLDEELGLARDTYHLDSMRLLSVFMETDGLYTDLCVYTPLWLDQKSLATILRGRPRADYEFVDFAFLDIDKQALLGELLNPTRHYHPTSGYRMLYTFIKMFGSPSNEDIVSSKQG